MAEDIPPDILKQTQDTLGKFIKKPVLTEKLLKKPPFRFLHDICIAAMKETGFFEGVLLGNDIKAESIKDKDAKIAFLQKVITAVESANNVKLSVKPNKVVAGHEPIKTNEFLQALATALEKQVPGVTSKTSLRKTKTQNAELKQEENIRHKNTSKKSIKPAATVPSKDVKKHKTSEKQNEGSDSSKKKIKEPAQSKLKKKPIETKQVEEHVEEKSAQLVNGVVHDEKEIEKPPSPYQESPTGKLPNGVDINEKKEILTRPVSAKVRPPSARIRSAVPVSNGPLEFMEQAKDDTDREEVATVFGNVVGSVPLSSATENSTPALAPLENDPLEATPKKQVPPPSAPRKKETDTGIVTRPKTAIRPPSARPASARPAAPRVRERGQLLLQEEVIKPAAGKVNLIVEQGASQVDEEEELVAVQPSQPIPDVSAEQVQTATEVAASGEGEHGHLVSQILEAQRELGDDAFSGKKGQTEIEWSASRNADPANKEVERLRLAIQTLTRSANPLGKLFEFIQEDVDTMQQELDSWRGKNASLSSELDRERSLTDQSIEPMKTHLDDLQHSIDQQMEQITALKATVLRNEQRMIRVLSVL